MKATSVKFEHKIEVLGKFPRNELAQQWIRNHKCDPPKGIKQPLLLRSAAYHLQAKRFGGLKAETRKRCCQLQLVLNTSQNL